MASGTAKPSRLRELRSWLFAHDGLHVKLLASFAVSVLAILFLVGIAVIASIYLYLTGARGEAGGLDQVEIVKISAFIIGALAAVALLIGSAWWAFSISRRHIAKVSKAEADVRRIVEASPDAIIRLDINGIIQWCNPATEAMFGYERDRLLGQKISKIITQRLFLHDVATAGRGAFMAFGQRQNFSTFPVEVSVSEAKDVGPGRTFIVLVHDASERRYSQETVHHISLSVSSMTGEEFVRNLVQQLSQVLQNDFAFLLETDTRPDTGLCSLTVAEHGRIRGKSSHNLSGTAFQEVLRTGFTALPRSARERFPHDEILRNLEAESFVGMPLGDHMGRSVGIIGVISKAPLENVGVAKQTLHIFAARAAAELERKHEVEVLASEKQRLHGDFTIMRDTAERERKRYEEEIAAEQELLTVTLRSIREGCITIGNDGRIVTVNPVAEDLTGWTQPEAADRPLIEVVRLVTKRGKRSVDVSLLVENPDQLNSQMLLVSRDGIERLVETTAAPIRNREDRKLGTVLVFRDVTEKQRVEEERHKAEKLESLGLAAGGIAHDFNNLLTAIIGNLSLAVLTAATDCKDRIEAAKKASMRAQDLAQQLLTFAKGGAPIKKTASMRQLVKDTIGFSLSGTNIRSDFKLPEDLWPVDIDAGQISQVISNLAVNAVQAMALGGTLHVTGENLLVGQDDAPPTLRSGRYVRITVRDEGPGIPEEIQKKIFDPYFTTKPKGSGLGLATSYSIVKNHDGLIMVESNPGEGATFTIFLPASEKEVMPEVAKPVPRSIRKGKILVLDDEEAICELVSYALTPLGYTVVQSYDADTTLRLYYEAMRTPQPFDAVIMDLTIPGGMGGKEAIKRLRQVDPAAKAIVSSGYAMDPIMSKFKDYGFCGVIAKPYDVNELQQVIHEALSS